MSKTINFKDIPGARQHVNPINTTADNVLDYARNKLSSVIVIGMNKETNEPYFASSGNLDHTMVNFMLDVAKNKLFEIISDNNNDN